MKWIHYYLLMNLLKNIAWNDSYHNHHKQSTQYKLIKFKRSCPSPHASLRTDPFRRYDLKRRYIESILIKMHSFDSNQWKWLTKYHILGHSWSLSGKYKFAPEANGMFLSRLSAWKKGGIRSLSGLIPLEDVELGEFVKPALVSLTSAGLLVDFRSIVRGMKSLFFLDNILCCWAHLTRPSFANFVWWCGEGFADLLCTELCLKW